MKRKVWLLTAAALWIISAVALGGCSAYHKIEEETSGPKVEVVESRTEQEEGPTLAPNTGEPETVPSLEVEEEDTFNPEIILATDVHYFAKELTDFGRSIRQWQNRAMESWHFMCGRSRTHFWMKWLSGNRRH